MIAALVGTAAVPAFAAANSTPETRTIQQVAADDAQSVVVASDEQPADLSRSAIPRPPPARSRRRRRRRPRPPVPARRPAAAAAAVSYSSVKVDLNMKGPGSGAIRWPLAKINHIGEGFGARGGEHQGVDLLTNGGTPIFAATSGTVNVSSEGYYGYGVAVTIDTVINGTKVTTLYGHMRYGSRQVVHGQKVSVGQVIGLVGSTGRSTANHLHFEVMLNGSHVDPLAWLARERRLTASVRHAPSRGAVPRVGANLIPDAQPSEGKPMGSTPHIRTMDALGLLVLRHHEHGCRTLRASVASPAGRRLFHALRDVVRPRVDRPGSRLGLFVRMADAHTGAERRI
ncbi:M23 family metallopeptidase [Microbacterium elymi]|uniref:M23 family metallopeptidase n=1 Tax=Microbacterium elymi TaxID=2909587 RepID=A0ABY5NIN5_9MICO|nr:M23 family metallopeptidase [Microbacterium elymi]UUT35018.1 M23 family metallopeptidase [Microbacterium elymi]